MSFIPFLFLVRSLNARLKISEPPRRDYTDRTRPTISISYPANGQRIKPTAYPFTLQVTGSAFDNVGIRTITASIDGGASSPVTTTGQYTWSYSAGIQAPGEHTVTVRATDAAGNTFVISQKFEASPVEVVVIPPQQPDTITFMHGINKHTFPTSGVTTQAKLLKFQKDNGFEFIRYRVYWEDYLNDPVGVANAIKETADAADRYGIKVIYANMQFGLSTYFGAARGFPPAMVSDLIGSLSQYATVRDAQKAFLRKYWDNALWKGRPLWDHQADFMLSAFSQYKDRASTRGYEIWNEPPMLEDGDHEKLKACQEYIAGKLLAVDPDAWIVAGHRFQYYATTSGFWNPADMVRTVPALPKVIYGPHIYQAADMSQAGFDSVIDRISTMQQSTGVAVMIGEWNDRTRPADVVKYARLIEAAKARNWMIALWQFEGGDKHNRCFNENYDVEPERNVWTTLLQAMGHPQVGSPK